jgi:threonine aldolase
LTSPLSVTSIYTLIKHYIYISMKTFKSDNYSGIHPTILESITKANVEHDVAYCDDQITAQCNTLFEKIFESPCKIIYVPTGTGANVLALKISLRQYEAVICAESAHINTNETGAPEAIAGIKIYAISTTDGKITPAQIRAEYSKQTVFGKHRANPKMVSISQCTEYGTVYNLEELTQIGQTCRELGLYLHIDCCRVYNACVELDCPLADIVSSSRADSISLGGTKLGCMMAESVVIFNPQLMVDTEYLQKNTLQLYSKNRFLACQYIALLENGLWKSLATKQNNLASLLKEQLLELGYAMNQKVESNHLFVEMPSELALHLQTTGWCYIWPDPEVSMVRIVINFDSTVEDLEKFMSEIQHFLRREI